MLAHLNNTINNSGPPTRSETEVVDQAPQSNKPHWTEAHDDSQRANRSFQKHLDSATNGRLHSNRSPDFNTTWKPGNTKITLKQRGHQAADKSNIKEKKILSGGLLSARRSWLKPHENRSPRTWRLTQNKTLLIQNLWPFNNRVFTRKTAAPVQSPRKRDENTTHSTTRPQAEVRRRLSVVSTAGLGTGSSQCLNQHEHLHTTPSGRESELSICQQREDEAKRYWSEFPLWNLALNHCFRIFHGILGAS